jgi:hypothetical protein
MGAGEARQLQAVFDRAQEPVGPLQTGGVTTTDVAVRRQRLQRREGVRAAQHVIGAAMHELQQLHRELHVTQATGAELELAMARLRGQRLLDAPAHGLHVGDEVVSVGGAPHEW